MNGQINGFHNSLIDEDCFLFTSESVGEGHPGKTRHAILLAVCLMKSATFITALLRRYLPLLMYNSSLDFYKKNRCNFDIIKT